MYVCISIYMYIYIYIYTYIYPSIYLSVYPISISMYLYTTARTCVLIWPMRSSSLDAPSLNLSSTTFAAAARAASATAAALTTAASSASASANSTYVSSECRGQAPYLTTSYATWLRVNPTHFPRYRALFLHTTHHSRPFLIIEPSASASANST